MDDVDRCVFARPIVGNFDVNVEPSFFDRVRELFDLDGYMPTVTLSGVGEGDGQYRVVDFREHADGTFTLDLREA